MKFHLFTTSHGSTDSADRKSAIMAGLTSMDTETEAQTIHVMTKWRKNKARKMFWNTKDAISSGKDWFWQR